MFIQSKKYTNINFYNKKQGQRLSIHVERKLVKLLLVPDIKNNNKFGVLFDLLLLLLLLFFLIFKPTQRENCTTGYSIIN